jgi:glycolate oxidase FAD binding subunit
MESLLLELTERVRAAAATRTELCIRAGGTKDFYGNAPRGERLDPRSLAGIVDYEPSELVVTVRAGTSLAVLEAALSAERQMLAFEPPHFGAGATVGGCVASGLAGPRRASAGIAHGSVRDFLLGARLVNGHGQLLAFGGRVMKNVAGYDVSRLLAGSLGILGVIVEVSLKVLPRPAEERTLQFELSEPQALEALNRWAARPLPVSASAWYAGTLSVRLSGAASAVRSALAALGGELLEERVAERWWSDIREQRHEFFAGSAPTWRLSLPSTAEPAGLPGVQMIEWGGALRWLRTAAPGHALRARAAELGGHATLFRGERDSGAEAFTPLPAAAAAIQRRLKSTFDPFGIFNPGRMYAGL